MSGVELAPAGRQELAEMRARPLSLPSRSSDLGAAERSTLTDAGVSASVASFHLGMGISALLVFIGGLIAAIGIRNVKEPEPAG